MNILSTSLWNIPVSDSGVASRLLPVEDPEFVVAIHPSIKNIAIHSKDTHLMPISNRMEKNHVALASLRTPTFAAPLVCGDRLRR